MLRVLAVGFHAATVALFVLLIGLVLFENGDFGPASKTPTQTILWSIVVLVGANVLFPLVVRVTPSMRAEDEQLGGYRPPALVHCFVALEGSVSMLLYMFAIGPAGGRREVLSIATPAVLLPIGFLLAWRAHHIGAKLAGDPPRDVSDWTAIDHLLGRRRARVDAQGREPGEPRSG